MASHSLSALGLLLVVGGAVCAQGAPQPPAAAPPVAPAAQPAPPPQLSTLWDGALVDTQNGDTFEETAGYRKLLQNLRAMSAEEAASKAGTPLNYPLVMKDPESQRGAWVKVRGLLGQVDAERLDRPLDGAEDVWRGWMSDTDGESDPVAFDILQRPAGLEVKKDLVDVEGIFYRTVKYETKQDKVKEVPYILAWRVARVDESTLQRHGVADGWALVLIILALGFIGMRAVMIMRNQKRGNRKHLQDHGDAIRKAARVSHHPPDSSGAKPTTPTPTPPDSP
ncbi:MAG TPA: hypothetical protein VFY71_06110 [Planctomycetota bacterium]|nr:hypothetical protein [Planctomycetota bacterium]